MRRALTALIIVLMSGVFIMTSEAEGPACTEQGTDGDDVRAGGSGDDVMCLLEGDDYGHGNGGADVVRGGPGDDAAVGGQGLDRLRGGMGNDNLFGIDRHPGDVVAGGSGDDRCFVDEGDKTRGCEHIFTGPGQATVKEALKVVFGATELGEEAQVFIENIPIPPPCRKENPPWWC